MSTATKDKAKPHENNSEQSNWRYQNKEYNESFKKWRKEKQNSIGFYYEANPNQLTYQDKVGFIRDYPEAHEARAFQRAVTVLGLMLIYRIIYDIFTMYFLPPILNFMGLDIHTTFFSGQTYGDETTIITINLITQALGIILPMTILIKHLQMPISVMLPTKITNKPMFRFSIPAMMLIAAVCSLMMFFYEELLSIIRVSSARFLMLPHETADIIYIAIAQILIIPILSEISVHGVMLQFTRQFGDGTALIITSLILTFTSYDITMMPFHFITSLVIGYFTIRTGSVITAVVMRIVQRLFVYTLYYLDYRVDSEYSNIFISVLFIVTIIIGLIGSVHFMCNHSDRFNVALKERYMSLSAKMLTAVSSVPLIIWFTLSFVVTILNLKFEL